MTDKANKPMPKKPKKSSSDDDLNEDILRIQADFANYKRRAEEEKMLIGEYAKAQVISDLLPVIDNIERAISHTPKDLEDNEWAKGISQVAKQLENHLNQMGLQKIATVGEEFDPNFHEAVSVEGDGTKEVVVEELQAGYILNEEVLRPAVVKVERK